MHDSTGRVAVSLAGITNQTADKLLSSPDPKDKLAELTSLEIYADTALKIDWSDGWKIDPSGRNIWRRFVRGNWTNEVCDNPLSGIDEDDLLPVDGWEIDPAGKFAWRQRTGGVLTANVLDSEGRSFSDNFDPNDDAAQFCLGAPRIPHSSHVSLCASKTKANLVEIVSRSQSWLERSTGSEKQFEEAEDIAVKEEHFEHSPLDEVPSYLIDYVVSNCRFEHPFWNDSFNYRADQLVREVAMDCGRWQQEIAKIDEDSKSRWFGSWYRFSRKASLEGSSLVKSIRTRLQDLNHQSVLRYEHWLKELSVTDHDRFASVIAFNQQQEMIRQQQIQNHLIARQNQLMNNLILEQRNASNALQEQTRQQAQIDNRQRHERSLDR